MQRRTLLKISGSLAAFLLSVPLFKFFSRQSVDHEIREFDLSSELLQTLEEVQEHLFPSASDSPGAKDINALQYFQSVLRDPFVQDDEKRFLWEGFSRLHKRTIERKGVSFAQLSWDDRETILREQHESSEGRQWLAGVLTYILEALLSDPVYGGNPNGIGWKWLDFQSGFPRPSLDKRYLFL